MKQDPAIEGSMQVSFDTGIVNHQIPISWHAFNLMQVLIGKFLVDQTDKGELGFSDYHRAMEILRIVKSTLDGAEQWMVTQQILEEVCNTFGCDPQRMAEKMPTVEGLVVPIPTALVFDKPDPSKEEIQQASEEAIREAAAKAWRKRENLG